MFKFSYSSSCVASSVTRIRHGLELPSASFAGDKDLCRPLVKSFTADETGSKTSSNRTECALLDGLLMRCLPLTEPGVCMSRKLAGDMDICRPLKGFVGEERRYSESPVGPRMSEELELREDIASNLRSCRVEVRRS